MNENRDAAKMTSAKLDNVTIATLMACVAIIGANSLALSPIAPGIARLSGESVVRVMVAGAAYGVGTATGAFFLARHIDRVGPKPALLMALAVLCAALTASALAPNVEFLIAAQALAGLAAGVGLPAIYSLAAVVAPRGRENTVLGRVLIGWTLSMVAGVSLSALIADMLHWRAVFGALALSGLVTLLAIGRISYETDRPARDAKPPSPLKALRIRGVVPLLLICFGYMVAFYGPYAYLGDHVHTGLGLSVKASGLIALSYGLGFGAAAVGDPYIDRFGARRLMTVAFAAIAAVYALLGMLSHFFALLVTLAFFWGIVNHFGLNLIVAGLAAIDPVRRGTILGLNSAVTYLAVSVGTLSYGVLYQYSDFASLAIASALIALAVAVYSTVLHGVRQPQHDAPH